MAGTRIKIGGPIKTLRLPPVEGAAVPRAIFARPTIPDASVAPAVPEATRRLFQPITIAPGIARTWATRTPPQGVPAITPMSRVPQGLLICSERAMTSPLAVLALWHHSFRHPEWIPHIIAVDVTIITDWRNTLSADSAAYFLKRWAMDPQWTRQILPAFIKNADFWLVAAYLQDLALDHPERFTAEDVACIISRMDSLGASAVLSASFLTGTLEELARKRPDLVVISPARRP